MKSNMILVFLFSLISLSVYGQILPPIYDFENYHNDHLGGRPFGMVALPLPDSLLAEYPDNIRIGESQGLIYVDDTEITGLDWALFCTDMSKILDPSRLPLNNADFDIYISNCYNEKWSMYDVMGADDPKGVAGLPITGISFSQAEQYCEWRTSMSRERSEQMGASGYYKYSLPSTKLYEWLISLVNEADSINSKKYSNFHYKGSYKSDLLLLENDTEINDRKKKKLKEQKYVYDKENQPFRNAYSVMNEFGLYGIIGNVSEMTNKEGVSKGGSFFQYASEIIKGQDIHYSKPESWLGFRTVVTIAKMSDEK